MKQNIISDIAEFQNYAKGDCHCFRGDMVNPPEQCDNCWYEVELQELRKWATKTSNNFANQELSHDTPQRKSPDCVKNWWSDYIDTMQQHQLSELQLNILFCYSILPIIEEEL